MFNIVQFWKTILTAKKRKRRKALGEYEKKEIQNFQKKRFIHGS